MKERVDVFRLEQLAKLEDVLRLGFKRAAIDPNWQRNADVLLQRALSQQKAKKP